MSLDGLRAWIGEVERKLGKRTRVFLALTVIAIGIGGAAIYLAIDARDSSVSESDVQALQEDLEARIGEGGGAAGTDTAQLEAELKALQAEVAELKGEGGGSQKGKGASGGNSGGDSGGGSSGSGGGASSNGAAGPAPSGVADSAKLQELLQRAKERAEEAE